MCSGRLSSWIRRVGIVVDVRLCFRYAKVGPGAGAERAAPSADAASAEMPAESVKEPEPEPTAAVDAPAPGDGAAKRGDGNAASLVAEEHKKDEEGGAMGVSLSEGWVDPPLNDRLHASTKVLRLITFDCVLRKGTQSNWREKQARIYVLCDAFCSHTALYFLLKNTSATAVGDQRMSTQKTNTKRRHTKEGRGVWTDRPRSEGHKCSYATSRKVDDLFQLPFLPSPAPLPCTAVN